MRHSLSRCHSEVALCVACGARAAISASMLARMLGCWQASLDVEETSEGDNSFVKHAGRRCPTGHRRVSSTVAWLICGVIWSLRRNGRGCRIQNWWIQCNRIGNRRRRSLLCSGANRELGSARQACNPPAVSSPAAGMHRGGSADAAPDCSDQSPRSNHWRRHASHGRVSHAIALISCAHRAVLVLSRSFSRRRCCHCTVIVDLGLRWALGISLLH